MQTPHTVAETLAEAFLQGEFATESLVQRGAQALQGTPPRWLRRLASRAVQTYGLGPRPALPALSRFIAHDAAFQSAMRGRRPVVARAWLCVPEMFPIAAARSWEVPPLCTLGSLAEWLDVPVGRLDALSDVKSLERLHPRESLRNYRYRVLSKGGGRVRLIEAPKPLLRAIQRQILAEILRAAPVHDSAHGFCHGRSTKTFATPHVDQSVVISLDLKEFFPSISAARVDALFRSLGYPARVAAALTALCVNCTPSWVWKKLSGDALTRRRIELERLYGFAHLPQGAPTSPALANLCAYRLDCRLAGLAAVCGGNYTRYADDLAFSGGERLRRSAARFQVHASAIVMEEGFKVNHRKTRIMSQGACQKLAGVVVNRTTSLPRRDVDQLKAILTNCVRFGPTSQNREGHADYRGHLRGRVAYVQFLHPGRGAKLRAIFEQIDWNAS
ncbi:MAG: RNA-directed DNA polymerase [Planctomycetales bacterium]|nr:RNA-directed DNA polymerase [Planctomycetales bacterium]